MQYIWSGTPLGNGVPDCLLAWLAEASRIHYNAVTTANLQRSTRGVT